MFKGWCIEVLYVFREKIIGFDTKVSIGDSFEDSEKNLFIIIYILKIKQYIVGYTNYLKLDFVAQKVGSGESSYEYTSPSTTRVNLAKMPKNILQTGDVVDSHDGIVGIVDGFNNIEYDGTDMIIGYNVLAIDEWSSSEINKAVKQNRFKKFKVIEGKASE